jgi:peptide/nickel transport system ATP-binding protein
MNTDRPLLEVNGLKKHFPIRGGILGQETAKVYAVDDVSFSIERGETLSLVGESGCGKSTVGKSILRLYPITDGEVWLDGERIDDLPASKLRPLRRRIQVVFQDPFSSLNPRMKVRDILAEPLINFGIVHGGRELTERVEQLMDKVQLPRDAIGRYPHEFSGGQRQRIGIARALALKPEFVVCDEPVSGLDVSVQSQIINLMQDLQRELGLTYLFISHNLAVVRHISTRIAVMYLGRIVELADAAELYRNPLHPYTEALLSAVPVPDPKAKRNRIRLQGDVPNPMTPPTGCHFHTRCPIAEPRCSQTAPELKQGNDGHFVACHLR